MTAQSLSLNLLSQDKFSETALGQVLMWALSIGRYIVVFTELIVIFTFLSRFKLDRQLTDLNSNVAELQAVVESYGDLETNVRQVQSLLTFIKDQQAKPQYYQLLETFSSLIPSSVRLKQLQLRQNYVNLTGAALSASSFSQLIAAMQSHPSFDRLELINVASQSDTDSSIVFELRAHLVDFEDFAKAPQSDSQSSKKPASKSTTDQELAP